MLLRDELLTAVGADIFLSQKQAWAKYVTGVDTRLPGARQFLGDFVNGEKRADLRVPALFLVRWCDQNALVTCGPDRPAETLGPVGVLTPNLFQLREWANSWLRTQKPVQPSAPAPKPTLLDELRPLMPGAADADIIATALKLLHDSFLAADAVRTAVNGLFPVEEAK